MIQNVAYRPTVYKTGFFWFNNAIVNDNIRLIKRNLEKEKKNLTSHSIYLENWTQNKCQGF